MTKQNFCSIAHEIFAVRRLLARLPLPTWLKLMLRLTRAIRHISHFRLTMASPPPDKKQKLSQDDRLHSYRTEDDVGITEYANDHPGFFGILKARYDSHDVSLNN